MAGEYTMSASRLSEPDSTIVQLTTDTGLVGWGEVCPAGPVYHPIHAPALRASLGLIAPNLLGLDPLQLNLVHDAIGASIDGFNEARAAIDIACWDLIGKSYGERICDLLGGPRMDPVSTYHVIGIGTPDEAIAKVTELQAAGHTKLQVKIGGRHVQDDIAVMRAVMPTIRPGVDVFADANRGLTVQQAILLSEACAGLSFAIEQPCSSWTECERLRPHLRHPLLLDECTADLSSISHAISSGLADGFGIKLSRMGGISAMRAVRDLCEITRTPMSSDDSWGGDIIAAACVHVGATLRPELSRGAWIADPYIQGKYDAVNGPTIVDGMIALPDGPGLGLDIDEAIFGEPEAIWS